MNYYNYICYEIRFLPRGGVSIDKNMMTKYSAKESKRMEDSYGNSQFQSRQYKRLNEALLPSHKWQENQFLDNKIDLFGSRKEVILSIEEQNTLLLRLVQTILNIDIHEDEKLKQSPLLRLYICYNVTKSKAGELLSFYIWLYTITREEMVRDQTINGVVSQVPFESVRIKQTLQSGFIFASDIDCARELIIRSFKYTLKGVVFGIKMNGRGVQYALNSTNDMDKNDLTKTWSDKLTYSSWCKFHTNNKRSKELKTSYGNINFFFRFRNCKKDPFVSCLTIASVSARKSLTKCLPMEGIAHGGINIIDVDNTSIESSILFVPLREFVSTAVCTIPLDSQKLPIVCTNNKNSNFIRKELKGFFSKTEIIKELVLIDLNPSRYNLNVGTDLQECIEEDL